MSLIFVVAFSTTGTFVPCAEPGEDCTSRQFPDGTVAEVVIDPEADWQTLILTARRPDGTAIEAFTDGTGAPDLTVENMFGFATVFTY